MCKRAKGKEKVLPEMNATPRVFFCFFVYFFPSDLGALCSQMIRVHPSLRDVLHFPVALVHFKCVQANKGPAWNNCFICRLDVKRREVFLRLVLPLSLNG